MNEELRSELVKDLEKSGFAAEMRVIQTIRHEGWESSGAGTYFDLDASITRTIDVKAHRITRNWKVGDGGVEFEYELFGEVKKSEKPWVVFRQKEESKDFGDAWDNPYVSHNEGVSLSDLTPLIRKHSIRANLGWLGYAVHEAFKKPQDTGRWYSAATTVCKAAYDYVHGEWVEFMKRSPEKWAFLALTQPVVILDGPLVSAEITDDDEVALEEIEFAPLGFEFGTAKYKAANYRVDLVTTAGLVGYLKVLQKRIDEIFGALYDAKRLAKPVLS